MNRFLFFRYGNQILIFLFSKRVQILKTEYKYGQYCTPLTQLDCRYFFVLAIILNMLIDSKEKQQKIIMHEQIKIYFSRVNRVIPKVFLGIALYSYCVLKWN